MRRLFPQRASTRGWVFMAIGLACVYGWMYGTYRLGLLAGDLDVLVWIGGLVAGLGLMLVAGRRNSRRFARVRQQAIDEPERLAAWAAAHDWKVRELGDAGLADEIERIEALTGNADWGHGVTGDQRSAGSDDWEFLAAAEKQTASGRLIVVSGLRYSHRRLWAALSTDATASQVTLDLVDDLEVRQSGELPALDEGEPVQNVLAGLEPITRLRIADGEILLCQPGRLEPEFLERTAERLIGLERRLPRRPGAGPQR